MASQPRLRTKKKQGAKMPLRTADDVSRPYYDLPESEQTEEAYRAWRDYQWRTDPEHRRIVTSAVKSSGGFSDLLDCL